MKGARRGVPGRSQRNGSGSESFLALKEKAIALALEIEDAVRTEELLTSKIEEERQRRNQMKKEIAQLWEPKVQDVIEKNKVEVQSQLSAIDKLVSEKKALAEECKKALGQIKQEQELTEKKVARIHEEGDEEIERAKRAWAEGEGARREKWLARRAQEAKELTLEGLRPELEHLMLKHKQDEQRLRDQLQLELAELRRAMREKGAAAAAAEKGRARAAFDEAARALRAEARAGAEEAAREGEEHLRILRQRLEKEAAAQRQWQDQELKRLEDKHVEVLAGLRAEEARALQQARDRAAAAQAREQEARAARRAEAAAADRRRREQWAAAARRRLEEDLGASDDKEAKRIAQERDAEIDLHIRKLQRQAKEEKLRIKQEFEEKLQQLTEETDAAVSRSKKNTAELEQQAEEDEVLAEEETQRKEILQQKLQKLSEDLKVAQEQLAGERDKFSAEQKKAASADAEALEQATAAREALTKQAEDAEAHAHNIEQEERDLDQRHRELLEGIEADHEQQLCDLDAYAKARLGEEDDLIARLADEVHTEELRAKRLQKLHEKYAPPLADSGSCDNVGDKG